MAINIYIIASRATFARDEIRQISKEIGAAKGSHFFGATGRTRTGDLLITNQLLYQLSHSSISL